MEMKLREYLKGKKKNEIIDEFINQNEFFVEYDKFLAQELGEVTYHDIINRFARQRSEAWLRGMGVSEKSIEEFNKLMGKKEEKNHE